MARHVPMRFGLSLPLFDALADPGAVGRFAREAEAAGWDGLFVWDHIHWRAPVTAVGDTQVTLAAIALATERIRFGPMVTPLARPPAGQGGARDRGTRRAQRRPVQRPRIPVWVAGAPGKPRPMRRAARYDGFFPINIESADQLAEMVARLRALRAEAGRSPDEPYDVVASAEHGNDDPRPYRDAGATWWLVGPELERLSVDRVRELIDAGPARE